MRGRGACISDADEEDDLSQFRGISGGKKEGCLLIIINCKIQRWLVNAIRSALVSASSGGRGFKTGSKRKGGSLRRLVSEALEAHCKNTPGLSPRLLTCRPQLIRWQKGKQIKTIWAERSTHYRRM